MSVHPKKKMASFVAILPSLVFSCSVESRKNNPPPLATEVVQAPVSQALSVPVQPQSKPMQPTTLAVTPTSSRLERGDGTCVVTVAGEPALYEVSCEAPLVPVDETQERCLVESKKDPLQRVPVLCYPPISANPPPVPVLKINPPPPPPLKMPKVG
jgi:hypothetical protein